MGEQSPPTPAVFNTGQVILGWVRAHRETGAESYPEAARRAADFLLTCLDERGKFGRGHSQFARGDATFVVDAQVLTTIKTELREREAQ